MVLLYDEFSGVDLSAWDISQGNEEFVAGFSRARSGNRLEIERQDYRKTLARESSTVTFGFAFIDAWNDGETEMLLSYLAIRGDEQRR